MGYAKQNRPALEITQRFFDALELSIALGKVKCLAAFCKKHHLNRTKYVSLKNGNSAYRTIDVDALSAICKDFDVSPRWLLLGEGKMLSKKEDEN